MAGVDAVLTAIARVSFQAAEHGDLREVDRVMAQLNAAAPVNPTVAAEERAQPKLRELRPTGSARQSAQAAHLGARRGRPTLHLPVWERGLRAFSLLAQRTVT